MTRTIILSYILLELSLLIFVHKKLCSLSCFGVQVVLDYKFCLLDNWHLRSFLRFQRFPGIYYVETLSTEYNLCPTVRPYPYSLPCDCVGVSIYLISSFVGSLICVLSLYPFIIFSPFVSLCVHDYVVVFGISIVLFTQADNIGMSLHRILTVQVAKIEQQIRERQQVLVTPESMSPLLLFLSFFLLYFTYRMLNYCSPLFISTNIPQSFIDKTPLA